jgi:hypothetical protein
MKLDKDGIYREMSTTEKILYIKENSRLQEDIKLLPEISAIVKKNRKMPLEDPDPSTETNQSRGDLDE